MNSLNRTLISGRLGKDAEHTPGDKERLKFSLAVTESWKDQQGQWQERVDWIDCTKWGKSAKLAEKLVKGRYIIVEGKLRKNEQYTRLIVEKIIFTPDGMAPKDEGRNRQEPQGDEYLGSDADDLPI